MTMEVHSKFMSSSLSVENIYNKAEDSGYHTSFTPGSLEHSVLNDSLASRTYDVTPELNLCRSAKVPLKQRNDITTDTPPPRRGTKRAHPNAEVSKPTTALPTPTTAIVGKIESLEVNEDKENATISFLRTRRLKVSDPPSLHPYPITPVKRDCRLSPCRSAKKLDFSIHSLSCKKHELQPVPEEVIKNHVIPIVPRPNQKIDILRLLCDKSATPAIQQILQHLSNEDTQNFCLVSKSWCQIWNLYSSRKKKQTFCEYLRTVKENQENCAKGSVSKTKKNGIFHGRNLREIHNEMNENLVNEIVKNISPPHSPRSNRFRKYTKSASLDSRPQLPCVKCSHPAKVTEEATGEEWVECTNATCSYQFCRSCRCSRHPGTSCCQYDLNAPSPSKRKKCEYAIGTMKSRKNLRRLL